MNDENPEVVADLRARRDVIENYSCELAVLRARRSLAVKQLNRMVDEFPGAAREARVERMGKAKGDGDGEATETQGD